MRIAWIAPEPTAAGIGGAGTYCRGIQRIMAAVPGVTEFVEITLRPRRRRMPHLMRQVLSLLRSVFSRYPAKYMFHMPVRAMPPLKARLREARPDLIVLASADMLFCRDAIGDLPYIVIAHNVEQELYREQVERTLARLPVARGFFHRDLDKVRRLETEGLRDASLVIAISEEDTQFFKGLGIATPFFILPPSFAGPLPTHARPAPTRPLRLAIVAKLSWWPNRLGCEWLTREIMMKLPPGVAELHIYGWGSESFSNPQAQTFAHGFVEDLADVWTGNHIAVCPILHGSGMNVKFVEALVNGMPTLTTTFGARGVDPANADPAIRILDTSESWIEFLKSPDAEAFATRCPLDETRSLFLDESHVESLKKAIDDALATGDQR